MDYYCSVKVQIGCTESNRIGSGNMRQSCYATSPEQYTENFLLLVLAGCGGPFDAAETLTCQLDL